VKTIAVAGLLLATLAIGLYGIQRSLWLDETWVANSVLSPTLSGMFYYPDWLQTTPPLFLLLTRGAVDALGLSNFSLRLVPLALSLVAVAAMLAAGWRILSPGFAVLGCALVAFHPTAIEYSRTLKQYSGEMAGSAIILLLTVRYLDEPSRRRFCWLVAGFVLTLPMAYAMAFLLPGVALVIGLRRGALLAFLSAAVLVILYLAFIRQNMGPQLRTFWTDNAQRLTPGLFIALLFCVLALALIRKPMIVVTVLPCLLLAVANALQWYPNSPRTRLFILPCFLLAVMIAVQHVFGPRRLFDLVAAVAAIVFVASGAWKQVHQHRDHPPEDFDGAVHYLQQHVAPGDLLLIHASVKEGFKLYSVMDRWNAPVVYGNTGYPCCRHDQSATTVSEDLDSKIPTGFHGRVWLFYSMRDAHWKYVGRDEGQFWRNYIAQRGCTPGLQMTLPNVAIGRFDCFKSAP
jgi:Dolichyl-phosphate-mannose-protein mannosyltransferase